MRLVQSLTVFLTVTALLSGCVINVDYGASGGNGEFGDLDTVFGDIRVKQGQTVGDISTVNGSIFIAKNAFTGNVDVVNGDIEISEGAQSQSLVTVNGTVTAGNGVIVRHDVATVNGTIRLSSNIKVGGQIKSINGDMHIIASDIQGNIENHNGDIRLQGDGILHGDIIIKANRGSKNKDTHIPTLSITQGFQVRGDIILEKQVTLKIDDAELLQRVKYDIENAM